MHAAEKTITSDHLTETLPADWYHRTDIYKQEQSQIFGRDWLLFSHTALLSEPGEYVASDVAGRSIFVVRTKEGELKGFHNVCRHRAGNLFDNGCGKAGLIRCQYHGWVYNTDGELVKTPDFEQGEKLDCKKFPLFPVRVKTWNGLVFINMQEEPADFDVAISGLREPMAEIDLSNLVFHSKSSHKLACNWKTYVENYLEGYHIPVVHPNLNREVNMKDYKVTPGHRIAIHETSSKIEDGTQEGFWIWLAPHAALNFYKGGLNLELMNPVSENETELHYYYFFEKDAPKEFIENTMATSLEVTEEDIKICETVQKNLEAGLYTVGKLSPKHEQGVAYFQSLVRDALKG